MIAISGPALLSGWHERCCGFIVREHGTTPHPQPRTALVRQGRIETGAVYEQQVTIDDEAGQPLVLRRIELHLDSTTEDGDTAIRLLTNVPKSCFTARKVAHLYRRRWASKPCSSGSNRSCAAKVASLGEPRAALLAFGVAVLAYNLLAMLQAAVRTVHDA